MSDHAIRDMVYNLLDKASSNLTDDELSNIACLSGETAKGMTAQLQSLVEGLGCLVSTDGRNKTGSGGFQDADSVSSLMFLIGSQLETILTLQELDDVAEGRLSIRRGV
jgi:hypothetical protein